MSAPADRRAAREAVRPTLLAYAQRVDRGDLDGVLRLFAPNAEADYGLGRARHGHAEIRPLLEALRGSCRATSHHISNVVAAPLGGNAVASRCYVAAWHRLEHGDMLVLGRYLDRLRWTDDGWVITRRQLLVHGGGPNLPPFTTLERTSPDGD